MNTKPLLYQKMVQYVFMETTWCSTYALYVCMHQVEDKIPCKNLDNWKKLL